jgi:putative sterol carrier protein
VTPAFPSPEYLKALENKLNSDPKYADVAKNWEGDMLLLVEPHGDLAEPITLYFDLWHGKCRKTEWNGAVESYKPAFILRSTFDNFLDILHGKLSPVTAMLTSKLHVKGSMAYMMRNVPVVLDFVRCAREIPLD